MKTASLMQPCTPFSYNSIFISSCIRSSIPHKVLNPKEAANVVVITLHHTVGRQLLWPLRTLTGNPLVAQRTIKEWNWVSLFMRAPETLQNLSSHTARPMQDWGGGDTQANQSVYRVHLTKYLLLSHNSVSIQNTKKKLLFQLKLLSSQFLQNIFPFWQKSTTFLFLFDFLRCQWPWPLHINFLCPCLYSIQLGVGQLWRGSILVWTLLLKNG